jgi:hypothetical protein
MPRLNPHSHDERGRSQARMGIIDSINRHWIRGTLPCRKHANGGGVKKGLERFTLIGK